MTLRLVMLAALVCGAVAILLPTFGVSHPYSSDEGIQLGVDLQGGIELVLQVQPEELVHEEVVVDVAYLKVMDAEESLRATSIRVVGADGLEVVSVAEKGEVVRFMDEHIGPYDHVLSVDGVHRFRLSEVRRASIHNRALEGTLLRVEDRARDLCGDRATVEPLGDMLVEVVIPGEVCL